MAGSRDFFGSTARKAAPKPVRGGTPSEADCTAASIEALQPVPMRRRPGGGIAFIVATLLCVFLWLAQLLDHAVRIHKPVLVATPLFIALFVYVITMKISNTKAILVHSIAVLMIPIAAYRFICVADEIEYYKKWGFFYRERLLDYIVGSIIIGETVLGGILYLILFVICYFAERFIDEWISRPRSTQICKAS